ncbi:MAG: sugar phosphate isomerase/epimerase [Betaproteobacteria bacterium]|nr:sugar phosphate isomerase/epimerase [Betaproteobacteria bacterium]
MQIALCNEVLQPLSFAQQCALAAALGYDGLEVAPFTLAPNPLDLTDAQAREYARVASDHGLAITGLHWLLVAPAGLSIVCADAALRGRTADAMCRMVELCAAMGGRYLVHGSPKQRSVPPGESRGAALERARECLARAAGAAQRCGVTYCIEPLAPVDTDLFNTVSEAARLVDDIGSPAFRTIIDCCAAGQAEAEPVAALIARWWPTGRLAHVQINDPNHRGPGQGEMAFAPIVAALQSVGYGGVLAVEPFDYVPDGPGCAARAIGYLRGLLEASEG